MILYTVARNSTRELVKADDAEKGYLYFCPVCNNELILRKSGNREKNSKRPHYAHETVTPNCTPETALHFAFKNLLAKKIQYHLDNLLPLYFSWVCEYCEENHSGNLMKKIRKIKVEHNLTFCQPDIVLFDNEDKVFDVIEIVVTHKPEAKVLQYYKDNNIVLIQINLNSDQDIDNLEKRISKPDIVKSCLNPKCKKCTRFMNTKELIYYKTICEKCSTENIVTCISKHGDYFGISEFSKEELELSKSYGLNTKWLVSKNGKKYLSNVCYVCNERVSEQKYVRFGCNPFPPLREMSEEEYYDSIEVNSCKRVKIGYYCVDCD